MKQFLPGSAQVRLDRAARPPASHTGGSGPIWSTDSHTSGGGEGHMGVRGIPSTSPLSRYVQRHGRRGPVPDQGMEEPGSAARFPRSDPGVAGRRRPSHRRSGLADEEVGLREIGVGGGRARWPGLAVDGGGVHPLATRSPSLVTSHRETWSRTVQPAVVRALTKRCWFRSCSGAKSAEPADDLDRRHLQLELAPGKRGADRARAARGPPHLRLRRGEAMPDEQKGRKALQPARECRGEPDTPRAARWAATDQQPGWSGGRKVPSSQAEGVDGHHPAGQGGVDQVVELFSVFWRRPFWGACGSAEASVPPLPLYFSRAFSGQNHVESVSNGPEAVPRDRAGGQGQVRRGGGRRRSPEPSRGTMGDGGARTADQPGDFEDSGRGPPR